MCNNSATSKTTSTVEVVNSDGSYLTREGAVYDPRGVAYAPNGPFRSPLTNKLVVPI